MALGTAWEAGPGGPGGQLAECEPVVGLGGQEGK